MACVDDFKTFWDNAIDEYERDTGRKLRNSKLLRTLTSADDLFDQVESAGGAFRNWRQKHQKLGERIKRFFTPVTRLGTIAQSAIALTPWAPAAAVLGGVLFLIQSCEDVSNAYDWIEDVFRELHQFSERLAKYVESEMDVVLQTKVAAVLAFVLRIFGRSEKLIKRNKFRHYLRVTFLGKDEETRSLIADMNKMLQEEEKYVIALTYASSRANEETGAKIYQGVTELALDVKSVAIAVNERNESNKLTQQGIAELGEGMRDIARELKGKDAESKQKEDELLRRFLDDTFATGDSLALFYEFNKKLLPGSGEWLQKEELFNTWIKREAPVLWVFGGPGAGKSYLSTWLIRRLGTLYPQQDDNPIGTSMAYFYIKENKETLRDPNTILKSFAWQIAQSDPLFRKHAIGVCSSGGLLHPELTWEKLFLEFYGSTRHADRDAILVIDGLDEASSDARKILLHLIKESLTNTGGLPRARIQFAVFGRPTLKQDMLFQREEKHIEKFINVTAAKNREDIDKFVKMRLKDILYLKTLRLKQPNGFEQAQEKGKQYRKKILLHADAVFLWAQLLIDEIMDKDEKGIKKSLENPPANLDEMIMSVFVRFAKDSNIDHGDVKKILSWVAYARRPLSFGELNYVLSLHECESNILLWESLRGRFASIFELKFPKDRDPDLDTASEANATQDESGVTCQEFVQDDRELNFGDSDDDDNGGDDIETDMSENEDLDTTISDNDPDSLFQDIFDQSAPDVATELAYNSNGAFSNERLQTIVTFTHQRIRDYLVREGSPQTRKKANLEINIDVEQVQIEITKDCLEILHRGLHNNDGTRYLCEYPARHFVWHLDAIDWANASDDDRRTVIDHLYWLFHDEDGIRSLLGAAGDSEDSGRDEFWRTWFATNQHTKALQACFRLNAAIVALMAEDVRNWIAAATRSVKALFEPLMTVAATLWLTKESYEDHAYTDKSEFLVWVLHAYHSLDDEGQATPEICDWAWYKSDFGSLEADHIIALAEQAKLEKTTHWYSGVGWILMEGDYLNDAISHFQEALRLDSKAWVASEGLARCLGDQGQYSSAVQSMEDALEALPAGLEFLKGYLYPHIAEWKLQLGDQDAAFRAAENGYRAEQSSVLAQVTYIQALCTRGDMCDMQQIVELAVFLDEWVLAEKNYSYLVRLFILGYDIYDVLGEACRRTEQKPDFLKVAFSTALDLVEQSNAESMKIWLPAQIAFFYHQYFDEIEEPIRLLELSLKLIATKGDLGQKKYRLWRKNYINYLAQMYFDVAVETRMTRSGSGLGQTCAKKLKDVSLVTEKSTEEFSDVFDFYTTGFPALLYGRWLREYQKAERSVWRKCFKARLLEEMNLLDDDDPSNDREGMHALAVTLFEAGDRLNAAAILAVLFKPLEDAQLLADQAQEQEEEEALATQEGDTNSESSKVENSIEGTASSEARELIKSTGGDKEDLRSDDHKLPDDNTANREGEFSRRQLSQTPRIVSRPTPEGGDLQAGSQGDKPIGPENISGKGEGGISEPSARFVDDIVDVAGDIVLRNLDTDIQRVTGNVGAGIVETELDGNLPAVDVNSAGIAQGNPIAYHVADQPESTMTTQIPPREGDVPLIGVTTAAKAPQMQTTTEKLRITTRPSDTKGTASTTTASTLRLFVPGDSWMYTCDICNRDAQDDGEIYFCEVCLNRNYCGTCLPLILNSTSIVRQCSPNHAHYRAWPIPVEAREMAVEWIEGEANLRREWLERLRNEWLES